MDKKKKSIGLENKNRKINKVIEIENEKKNKNVTKKNTTKKVTNSSKNPSTKKVEGTTNKSTTNPKAKNAKNTNNGAKKNGMKNNTPTNKKVEVKTNKAPITKEVLETPNKVETIKKTKKVEVKEEVKKEPVVEEQMISTKTWIITALCGLLIIVSIIAFSLANKFKKVEETDYYVYVEGSNLMVWDRENENGTTLSSTFLVDPEKEFNYANEAYYFMEEDKIYFIDNIKNKSFDVSYVLKDDISKKERKATRAVEQVNDYLVEQDTVAYVKDNKLYVLGNDKELATNIIDYKIAKDGKNVYYTDSKKTVYVYNVSDKASKKVVENYESELMVVDNDLYTVLANGYLFDIYKNGTLFVSNVTDYSALEDSIIYYRYDEKLDAEFDKLTKEYDDAKMSYEDVKKIMNNKERVLLVLGKPTCGYCTLLLEVFDTILKEKEFSYAYINTDLLEDGVLEKILKFINLDEQEFGTPTLVVTQNGKFITKNVGYMDETAAKEFLEKNKIFTSKFKYENKEQITFSPEVMFWASDTYTIENGKEKKLSEGALYLTSPEDLENDEYKVSFVPTEKDYTTSSASDLYYSLNLSLTNRDGKTINNKVAYSSLQALYLDSIGDYVLYQSSDAEKAQIAKIKNGKLKNKATIDTSKLCQVNSTIRGTAFINDCDSYGFGKLSIFNGSKLKEIDENVYQVFKGTDKYSYYIKYDEGKSTYILYSYKRKSKKIDEIYYALQPTSDVFYLKENVKVTVGEDEKESNTYTYELYIMNEKDKSVLLTDNTDVNFLIIPIDEN